MNNFIFKQYVSNINDGNTAFHVGLDIGEAKKNRQKICEKLGLKYENLISMDQTHSANVQIVDEHSPKIIENCDALITNLPDLPIMVMVADCLPICLQDPILGVIAVVHSGRNGTFLEILKKTIQKMKQNFGCDAKNLMLFIGPHIKSCCYEVSDELAHIAQKSFGMEFCNNRFIDLEAINIKMALEEGLRPENITNSQICTHCSNEPYFSYRKDPKCGRFCLICAKISTNENQ